MASWLAYIRQRFPIPVYVLVAGGLALSGAAVAGHELSPFALLVGFAGLVVFFFLLRLMDERKDYEKDKVAHPQRPLPSGLLDLGQVDRAIRLVAVAMISIAVFSAVLINVVSGVCYLLVTAYLWLMYREFFISKWLEPRPVVYAVTHQVVLIPLCYFCVTLSEPALISGGPPFFLSLFSLGAFFAYEVCRKLDPSASAILKTYLSVHGPTGAFLLVLAGMLVSAAGGMALDVENLILPVQVLLLLSLTVVWLRPSAYKIPEVLSALTLFAHLWALPLKTLL